MAAKVTLKEIAQVAGVSISTVSLVLNNRPCRVSKEKRQLIKAIAQEKHYVPNQIARSLVMQRSGTLGLIVPNIESRFFSRLAKNLEQRCRAKGYALFITTSDDYAQNDIELMSQLVYRGVDGLFIVHGNQGASAQDPVEHLRTLPVPFVLVDRVFDGLGCDQVLFDNEFGGFLATTHLLEAGHRHIACIVNAAHSETGAKRLTGYRHALEAYGVPFDPELVIQSDYYIQAAFDATAHIDKLGATAVFASSDNIALGLLKRLYDLNWRVPRDLSVVSYDNSAADSLFDPALTAIDQDVALLADEALGLMARRLRGDASAPVARLLRPRLVERDSVRRIGRPGAAS